MESRLSPDEGGRPACSRARGVEGHAYLCALTRLLPGAASGSLRSFGVKGEELKKLSEFVSFTRSVLRP